jgi:hypothetical protein
MRSDMVKYGIARVIKVILIVIIALFVFGFATMHLWNWLMPTIFGLTTITFWQALGLVVLGKILFGGFHRHGGGGRGWKRHMEQRWAGMSSEEQERFRAGMRGRRWCQPATGKPDAERGSL